MCTTSGQKKNIFYAHGVDLGKFDITLLRRLLSNRESVFHCALSNVNSQYLLGFQRKPCFLLYIDSPRVDQ